MDADELLEEIGELVDQADNFLAYELVPHMPQAIFLDAMKTGLQEVRDRLRDLYVEAGGEDRWDGGEG